MKRDLGLTHHMGSVWHRWDSKDMVNGEGFSGGVIWIKSLWELDGVDPGYLEKCKTVGLSRRRNGRMTNDCVDSPDSCLPFLHKNSEKLVRRLCHFRPNRAVLGLLTTVTTPAISSFQTGSDSTSKNTGAKSWMHYPSTSESPKHEVVTWLKKSMIQYEIFLDWYRSTSQLPNHIPVAWGLIKPHCPGREEEGKPKTAVNMCCRGT